MIKTSAEFEQEFMQTALEKTGKSVEQWFPVIKSSGFSKQMDILNWLKADHQFNHLQASLLAGLYLNNGQPVYQNEVALLDSQFAKCEAMRPVFEVISDKILSFFPDTILITKKTYLSYTANREFAAINIKPKEIRLGIDLGSEPFTETLQKSKLVGAMPRISHMLTIIDSNDLDESMIAYLQQSYDRSHKK
jgi:predicted transport protein